MSPPVSSPLSTTSFPSSTTSKGYDENSGFILSQQQQGLPTGAVSTRKPTSASSPNPRTQQQQPLAAPVRLGQRENINTNDSSQHSRPRAASPKPPRTNRNKVPGSPVRLHPTVKSNGTTPTPMNSSHNRPVDKPVQSYNSASAAALESLEAVRRQSDSLHLQVQKHTGASSSRTASTTPATIRKDAPSINSQTSAAGESWKWEGNQDPDNQEQALFEQRLTEDIYGVAVRKINHNGKSNLRYVKCSYVDASELDVDASGFSSSRSVSSNSRSRFRFRERTPEGASDSRPDVGLMKGKPVRVLIWGKKKDVKLPLDRFVCVRKGKTTDRTRRNMYPASRLLSLITDDPNFHSLDIEAPTRTDRDKFARAFSRFLKVPLEGDDARSIRSDLTPQSWKESSRQAPMSGAARQGLVTQTSAPDVHSHATNNSTSRKHIPLPVVTTDKESSVRKGQVPKPIPRPTKLETAGNGGGSSSNLDVVPDPQIMSLPSTFGSQSKGGSQNIPVSSSRPASTIERTMDSEVSQPAASRVHVHHEDDEGSAVSSITGAGFDQEIVEELHMALNDLRAELEESRAEAARAVKVAEQAIQSAENSNSKDWSATVTHKAAEAAALAQKKSAEAMAKARLAEERLDQERRKAASWKKQAEAASEEAGYWQTRAAAADVQRAAVVEELESERNLRTGETPSDQSPLSEVARLRAKLAMETSTRRKLLAEVQDLRGTVRIYCRPRAPSKNISIISAPSQELLLLHRERSTFKAEGSPHGTPLSFTFDGILDTGAGQKELYDELEPVCLSALDGFNSCVIAYGQSGSGKTYTMLGNVSYEENGSVVIDEFGLQLQAAEHIFSLLERRSERYRETISFSLVEVSDERLVDLVVGTELGEAIGRVEGSKVKPNRKRIDSHDGTASNSERQARLEIKTNRDGEVVVHGLVWVELSSFEDVVGLWEQCLVKRRQRLVELGVDIPEHDAMSHMIGTFKIQSTNIVTGVSTTGKVQFVDLAASNVVPRRAPGSVTKKASTPESIMSGVGNSMDWKFSNRSMTALSEVVDARSQFQRSVPYRNSTITHLLSDSLEADTKVVLVACVSSDLKDMQETACTLKFAQTLGKVVIGKATKHSRVPS
eukprot:Nitzschia sp. Nitz4//scaffold240_size29840//1008//4428//NITZ4_008014-RA/size29840-augustus-gene-0.29-mRNA-1//-1//CDS//3329543738//5566//frame0